MIQLTHPIAETIPWDMDNLNIHFTSCLNILNSSANCWTKLQETNILYIETKLKGKFIPIKLKRKTLPPQIWYSVTNYVLILLFRHTNNIVSQTSPHDINQHLKIEPNINHV